MKRTGIRKNKKTCPEESLFQLGTMDDHAPPEVLLQVAVEFMTTFDERFGSHIHILDWALHLDEEPEYGGRRYLEKQDFIMAKQKEKIAAG